MAVTAADVRSIFSLHDSAAAGPTPKKVNPSQQKKPDGISRELYSLIGDSAPSLAAQLAKPRLKQKPNLGGGGGRTHWEWRAFKNPARNDSLQLSHWVKASGNLSSDYMFAKYNIQSTNYNYTDDEYTKLLEDPEWSRNETDYLFSMVQEYDSRWYIIHDRYNCPEGLVRSMEDLKDRYYSVCRKLIRNRPWPGDDSSKAQLLSSFQFDKERETTRKKYVASLENRTEEQIIEEEALYIELKRLEQNERKFKRDREDLLRIFAGIDSGLPEITEDDGGPLGITSEQRKRKKGSALHDLDSPATPSSLALASPVIKRTQTAKNLAYDAQHCIVRTDHLPMAPTTKSAHQPAFLRSSKLPVPKAAIAPKIAQTLAELGVSLSRLVMPTRENCARLDALVDAATGLVETKRLVDKVEYDIQVAKNRFEIRDRANAVDEVVMGSVMEGDDGEGTDGREQSVASVRSAHGRKVGRRSMSISSVDTTLSQARAATKRQKRG